MTCTGKAETQVVVAVVRRVVVPVSRPAVDGVVVSATAAINPVRACFMEITLNIVKLQKALFLPVMYWKESLLYTEAKNNSNEMIQLSQIIICKILTCKISDRQSFTGSIIRNRNVLL